MRAAAVGRKHIVKSWPIKLQAYGLGAVGVSAIIRFSEVISNPVQYEDGGFLALQDPLVWADSIFSCWSIPWTIQGDLSLCRCH